MNETKRSRQISFRVTETEFQRLLTFAQHANVRPTEMARQFVTSPSHATSITTDRPYDPAVIKRLDGIGQTLLRLEKAGQENLSFAPELTAEISTTVKGIHTLIETAVLERVRE